MGTEDELKRCGQAAAALMGVAAARAKQVAEQLLGSRESAKKDAKQRAGSLVDEGRRAAADVISALRKEASVLFRDLDHLEEHLRGGKGPAPAPSASGGAPYDQAAGPARKATTARATAARKSASAAEATVGATSPAAKTQGRKRAAPEKAAPEKVAGAGKKATAARASTARKAGGAGKGGAAGGSSSRGRA
jgi:DNA-binding protein HU-beta